MALYVGSHDSGAYQFDFSVSFWNEFNKWELLRMLAYYLPCIRYKIESIAQTQHLSIYEQLCIGITVLDLRISCANNILYTSHTFCCVPLTNILDQIVVYSDKAGSTTPISIMISPDYANRGTLADKESFLLGILHGYLIDYIIDNKIQLYYAPLSISIDEFEWINNSEKINKLWYNVPSTAEFEQRFFATDFGKLGKNGGLDCVLTPSETDIHQIWNTSLKRNSEELAPIALRLLKDSKKNKKPMPSFCMFDHVNANLIQNIMEQ